MPQCTFRKSKLVDGVDLRRCKNEALPERKLCSHHVEMLKLSGLKYLARKQADIASGMHLCSYSTCRRTPTPGKKLCESCLIKLSRHKNARRGASKAQRLAGQLCSSDDCPRPPEVGYKFCTGCRSKAAETRTRRRVEIRKISARSSKKTRAMLKGEVFLAYGTACACCGETTYEFLSIDHTNGDGAKHRKEIGTYSSAIYKWLKKNNYPPGFRTLCMNCNYALGLFGYCPHGDLAQLCTVGRKISATATSKTVSSRAVNSERNKRKRLKLKLEVFTAYGGCKCFCCGESHHECLSLDHIDGGGSTHVKAVGSLYPWLKRMGYPSGFRVACINCNRALYRLGSCPHQVRVA